MEVVLPIILFIAGFATGAFVIWQIKQKEIEERQRMEAGLEEAFSNLSRQALTENQSQFLDLARNEFKKLEDNSGQQLNQKKELIDSSLKTIATSIKQLNEGTDRLHGQVEHSTKRIENLSNTTDQLRRILSSSQARGQWGERMVEDILNLLGMLEGKNYEKQTTEGGDRPDFTFHLPKGKRLNMDVKFPITHYELFLSTEDETTRETEKKQFLSDIRGHVKAVAGRSYIDPAGGTVDYVLLFIPNESIYSFINQKIMSSWILPWKSGSSFARRSPCMPSYLSSANLLQVSPWRSVPGIYSNSFSNLQSNGKNIVIKLMLWVNPWAPPRSIMMN